MDDVIGLAKYGKTKDLQEWLNKAENDLNFWYIIFNS